MIVVKVELRPASGAPSKALAELQISNDDTGNVVYANYDVSTREFSHVGRVAKVFGYRRAGGLSIFELITRALLALEYGKDATK